MNVHNPANVPEDKLLPGHRFLTTEEFQERYRMDNILNIANKDIKLWMIGCGSWDQCEYGYSGSVSINTYCVPNDFKNEFN